MREEQKERRGRVEGDKEGGKRMLERVTSKVEELATTEGGLEGCPPLAFFLLLVTVLPSLFSACFTFSFFLSEVLFESFFWWLLDLILLFPMAEQDRTGSVYEVRVFGTKSMTCRQGCDAIQSLVIIVSYGRVGIENSILSES